MLRSAWREPKQALPELAKPRHGYSPWLNISTLMLPRKPQ
jgi:hypothetical protein